MLLYKALWYFVIYAVLGWCLEVAYHTVTQGGFVNRGFLNGPYCPIYGVGASVVILLLEPLSDHVVVLFFASAVLCSALEWITGWVLEHLFHNKWWDYSDKPFNLNGYVCLAFSIGWGFACVTVMRLFQPPIEHLVKWSFSIIGIIVLILLLAVFSVDAVFTVLAVRDMNKRFARLENAAAEIRRLSDGIGLHINDAMLSAMEMEKQLKTAVEKSDIPEKTAELKQKLDSLKEVSEKYKSTLEEQKKSHKRLLDAFPSMSGEHKKASEKIRDFIEKNSRRK